MRNSSLIILLTFGALATPNLAAAKDNPWQSGPDMETGRRAFPLVELASGEWIIAGGTTAANGGFGAGAELLTADATTWTTIASMPTAHRGAHQGIRLRNGDVLVAGDDPHVGGHPHPRTAYTYSDISSTWTRTANDPVTHRFLSTLTRLPDGRVLFAGGYSGHGGGPTYSTAEIYDPNSASWSSTGSMSEVRTGHTATLLTTGPNAGRVLVVGGSDRAPSNTATNGCELYDPASGTWSPAGSMNESRSLHTITQLPSGDLLAVGGQFSISTMGRSSAELYNPLTNTWSQVASMLGPRRSHTATLLPSGEVLVVGGAIGFGSPPTVLNTAEVYDPSNDSWSATDSMTSQRFEHSAGLLADGRVIVVGGGNGVSDLSSTEIFDSTKIPVELLSFSIE